MRRREAKTGTEVYVTADPEIKAKRVSKVVFEPNEHGAVMLCDGILGFQWWNIEDLRLAKKRKK